MQLKTSTHKAKMLLTSPPRNASPKPALSPSPSHLPQPFKEGTFRLPRYRCTPGDPRKPHTGVSPLLAGLCWAPNTGGAHPAPPEGQHQTPQSRPVWVPFGDEAPKPIFFGGCGDGPAGKRGWRVRGGGAPCPLCARPRGDQGGPGGVRGGGSRPRP